MVALGRKGTYRFGASLRPFLKIKKKKGISLFIHMDDFSNMMALLYENTERKTKGGKVKIKEEIIMPLRQGQKHSISLRGAEREAGFSRVWRKSTA